MSKRKRNMYGQDKDGYHVLVPQITCVQGNSTHREDSAAYWEERCKQAEAKYDRLKKTVNRTYRAGYDDTLEADLKLIEQMEQEMAEEAQEQEQEQSEQHTVSSGVGLSFGPGKDPKLYRVEDPDGPLIPRERFVGGEIEIDPGRGFHFGLHWNKR